MWALIWNYIFLLLSTFTWWSLKTNVYFIQIICFHKFNNYHLYIDITNYIIHWCLQFILERCSSSIEVSLRYTVIQYKHCACITWAVSVWCIVNRMIVRCILNSGHYPDVSLAIYVPDRCWQCHGATQRHHNPCHHAISNHMHSASVHHLPWHKPCIVYRESEWWPCVHLVSWCLFNHVILHMQSVLIFMGDT